jgi:hypothetical protein
MGYARDRRPSRQPSPRARPPRFLGPSGSGRRAGMLRRKRATGLSLVSVESKNDAVAEPCGVAPSPFLVHQTGRAVFFASGFRSSATRSIDNPPGGSSLHWRYAPSETAQNIYRTSNKIRQHFFARKPAARSQLGVAPGAPHGDFETPCGKPSALSIGASTPRRRSSYVSKSFQSCDGHFKPWDTETSSKFLDTIFQKKPTKLPAFWNAGGAFVVYLLRTGGVDRWTASTDRTGSDA